MFEWHYFAIAASFLWALTNLIGKYSLSKINRETSIVACILGGFLVSIPVWFFYPISFSLIAIVGGVFWFVAFCFYFYGLFESEVSKAVALFLSIPVFVAIISAVFLNEYLASAQYFGIILAVISAVLISLEKKKGNNEKFKINRGAILMLASSFFFAISDVCSKVASLTIDPISVFFWVQLISAIVGLSVVILWRKKIDFVSNRIIVLCIINDIFSCLGAYLFIVAYSLTFISRVTALETIQPVFVLIMALLITKIKPEWLKEEINRESLITKVIALVFFIIGVLLVVN